MRRASILSLLLLGLATSISWAQGPPPRPAEQHRQNGKPGKPNKFLKIIGSSSSENFPERTFIINSTFFPKDDPLLSQDVALEDALEKAHDKVVSYLHDQTLGGEWNPSAAFIRDSLRSVHGQSTINRKEPQGNHRP